MYVIFSIDNASDMHTLAKFTRYIDTKKMLDKMSGNCIPCIGMYKGVMEYSFLCNYEDYVDFIANSGYVDNQESVLEIGPTRKRKAHIWYSNGAKAYVGWMSEVSYEVAMKSEHWTYRPDLNKYWTTP